MKPSDNKILITGGATGIGLGLGLNHPLINLRSSFAQTGYFLLKRPGLTEG